MRKNITKPPADSVFDEFVRQCSPQRDETESGHGAATTRAATSTVPVNPPLMPPNPRPQPLRAKTVAPPPAWLPPMFLNYSQVAETLSVSVRTVQYLVTAGALAKPKCVSPGRVGFRFDDVKAYADSCADSDILPPSNSHWRAVPAAEAKTSRRAAAPIAARASAINASSNVARVQPKPRPAKYLHALPDSNYIVGSRQDRTGELPRLGSVYGIPGTNVVWLKRHDKGGIAKPFALAINRDGYTWAELELSGYARDAALLKLLQS